jgi:hypothetical protein
MGSATAALTPPMAYTTRSHRQIRAGPFTDTFGLGTDNQIYLNIGNWAKYPRTFMGWARVT